jgi:hypothetical protein
MAWPPGVCSKSVFCVGFGAYYTAKSLVYEVGYAQLLPAEFCAWRDSKQPVYKNIFCRVSCTIQTPRFHLGGHVFSELLGKYKNSIYWQKSNFLMLKPGFIDCLANNMPSLSRIFAQWFQIQQFFTNFG